ncbi:MAG: RNA methyltransferase [Gammaproteobacteria bacterium]|nr:RNA methyltransferase [Gammaproteobacteria bacterium]MCP4088944.1 RNA methyltransferase [Gammaproteobacteria bacterium]MCP4274961.1 RNA methyltransferase [Gammaproteobacteria bacterium]MCP4831972.1 RNA methyltransferase [Gammaproteobacteria bacterium]MCP4929407.1 RNA methyltransferase [Gammaproteobacteria bacterium]
MNHPIRFVLCETSHPGNIGAAARAIKTMGFSDLTLVNPKEFPSREADVRASGAVDVLQQAKVVATLGEAIADSGLVVGASARRRKHHCPELNPRECAGRTLTMAASKEVAIVFGTERVGLSNEQMDQCNALVYIPANPDYSSLNLASAVQLIAYELRFAQDLFEPLQEPEFPPASGRDMELFYEHLERVMFASGFLKPNNPRHTMRKLRRLFNRAEPDEHELNILRGLLASVETGDTDD